MEEEKVSYSTYEVAKVKMVADEIADCLKLMIIYSAISVALEVLSFILPDDMGNLFAIVEFLQSLLMCYYLYEIKNHYQDFDKWYKWFIGYVVAANLLNLIELSISIDLNVLSLLVVIVGIYIRLGMDQTNAKMAGAISEDLEKEWSNVVRVVKIALIMMFGGVICVVLPLGIISFLAIFVTLMGVLLAFVIDVLELIAYKKSYDEFSKLVK